MRHTASARNLWLHLIHLGNIPFFLLLSIPFLFGSFRELRFILQWLVFISHIQEFASWRVFKYHVKKDWLVHGQDKLICKLRLPWAWCMEYSSFGHAVLRALKLSLSGATVCNDLLRLNSAKTSCCKLLMCYHFTFLCMNRPNNISTCTVPFLWWSQMLYTGA